MNPCWQQKKLIEFCKENGIIVFGYAPLGAIGTFYGCNRVLECQVLKEVARGIRKTVPQVIIFFTLIWSTYFFLSIILMKVKAKSINAIGMDIYIYIYRQRRGTIYIKCRCV